jgi:peptidyl-prolyl cis-trans isomerase SurA
VRNFIPFLAVLLLLAPPATGQEEEQVVDGIAAQVGTDIVLASEVDQFAGPVQQKMKRAGAGQAEVDRMRAEILDRLIERRLIEQAVRRVEIDASEAEIDTAIASIAAENGLTPDQLQHTVVAKGMTYETYREQIRGEIQRQKLVGGAIRSQVKVEDAEVRALYDERYAGQPEGGEEVRLRHLLIPFEDDSASAAEAACAKARTARARVEAGSDFATVAQDLTAVNPEFGGDVGWVHASTMASWMTAPVAGIRAGEMTPVIQTPFGCNVLFLVQRREFKRKTFEEAEPELYAEIFDERMADEYQAFVNKLREQTYIERKGVFANTAPSFTDPSRRD